MKRLLLILSAVFALIAGLIVAWRILRGGGEIAADEKSYVYRPVEICAGVIAAIENPTAESVLLLGIAEGADVLENLGLAVCSNAVDQAGSFDIVFTDDAADPAVAASFVSEKGVLVQRIDVTKMSVADFRRRIEAFPFAGARFWMPGERTWLLVGRRQAEERVPLEAMMDLFARDGAFDILAEARVTALSDVFAGYVGTCDGIADVFTGEDLTMEVRPEFFLTREIPAVEWIDPAEVDEDIVRSTFGEIRSMQVIRRLVVEGAMKSAAGDPDGATDAWARALRRNPNDLFLRERLDRLARNARAFLQIGNVTAAAKCYETMVVVDPSDVSAVYNYGICLKRLGKTELAGQVLEKAKEMGK